MCAHGGHNAHMEASGQPLEVQSLPDVSPGNQTQVVSRLGSKHLHPPKHLNYPVKLSSQKSVL